MSHEIFNIAGAEAVIDVEGHMCGAVMRGAVALPGSKATSRTKGSRRRPNAYLRELRRGRIFTRLREGWPHTEIAREEGLTDRRIRQIVSDTLKKRPVDAPADHALLQLARLESALRLAAGAVADGDVRAIRYYLKLLDQLDRYQPGAAAPQAYDDAARERLRQDGPDRRALAGENR